MRTLPHKSLLAVLSAVLSVAESHGAKPKPEIANPKPELVRFEPFTWPGGIPEGCPFPRSTNFHAVRFLGVKSGFRSGDTWYPTWAENDILYSPWTDGKTKRLDGATDWSQSWVDPVHITTGQGIIPGDDPLNLIAYRIGLDKSSPAAPYPGRYPCGSLIHNGVWCYGTYCLRPGDEHLSARSRPPRRRLENHDLPEGVRNAGLLRQHPLEVRRRRRGDDVAPMVTKGRSRTLQIPPGKWKAEDGTLITGPIQRTFDVPLGRLLCFERQERP